MFNHDENKQQILNYVESLEVPFESEDDGNILILNDGELELRYIDSIAHKKDYSERFGIKGIPSGYFYKITKEKLEEDIRVIWIKDFEWENKNKQNVLKSYIKSAVGKITKRIYARDCEIKVYTNKEIRSFSETNCFYGYRSSSLNLGLVLKKPKHGLEKGTLVQIYTFGHPFFGKGLYDIEIIRVGTLVDHQVIGGASKLLKHFLLNYPTLTIGGKERECEKIVFIVDADHNDGRSLQTLGFDFVSYKGAGFMNMYTDTGKVFHRQPMKHKEIMEQMAKGEVIAIENAGNYIYTVDRSEYIKRYE